MHELLKDFARARLCWRIKSYHLAKPEELQDRIREPRPSEESYSGPVAKTEICKQALNSKIKHTLKPNDEHPFNLFMQTVLRK